MAACEWCGKEIEGIGYEGSFCSRKCYEEKQNSISPCSKNVDLLICIFAGYFGAHKFYEGKTGKGILYLFTAGLFLIGWISDIIKIASGNARDGKGRPIKD